MESVKAFVNKVGNAVIKCPACRSVTIVPDDRMRQRQHSMKVRCRCGEVFAINLESRQSYRKKTMLPGRYRQLQKDVGRDASRQMVVLDLSMSGLGFSPIGSSSVREGEELEVEISLDDERNSVIKRQVVVQEIRRDVIGCEFLNVAEQDKVLGFYLMP